MNLCTENSADEINYIFNYSDFFHSYIQKKKIRGFFYDFKFLDPQLAIV